MKQRDPRARFRAAADIDRRRQTDFSTAQITARVRAALDGHHYQPGERLLSRDEMAEEFSVSPPTLDRALEPLVAAGTIEKRLGRSGGLFVATRPSVEHRRTQLQERVRAFVRNVLSEGYAIDEVSTAFSSACESHASPISRFERIKGSIGAFRSGKTDIAERHDEYLDS